MDDYVRSYNIKIRELLEVVNLELEGNKTIEVINRYFRVALLSDRTLIIEESGPQLWEYRDLIAEGRWDELINERIDDEIENSAHLAPPEVSVNALKQIVALLRKVWDGYDEESRNHVKKTIKKLLSLYIKYAKAKVAQS